MAKRRQVKRKNWQQFSLWHSVISEHVIPSEVEGSPLVRNTFGWRFFDFPPQADPPLEGATLRMTDFQNSDGLARP